MSPFSLVEAASKAVSELASEIHRGRTLLRKDSIIIFVCGANSTKSRKSNREEILDYVARHLAEFRFFRAEEVFDALDSHSIPDLLSVEDNLGNYSDCIILICESESAYAELGAFALSESLVRQLLIVNDEKFRSSNSFINLGPISKADKKSKFKPTIFTDFSAILKCMPDISERLRKIPHKKRRPISFGEEPRFAALEAKIKLLFLVEIVTLFAPVTRKELVSILDASFPNENTFSVATELALAISLGFLASKVSDGEQYYLSVEGELPHFFDFSILDRVVARSWVTRAYFHGDRERLMLLSGSA